MFIIFGWQTTSKPVESVLKTECYHCKNMAGWSIWKETFWLELFFIRLIPINSKYRLACNICGDSVSLPDNMARDALNPNKRTQELHDQFLKIIEEHQFSGMTETQRDYWKSKNR